MKFTGVVPPRMLTMCHGAAAQPPIRAQAMTQPDVQAESTTTSLCLASFVPSKVRSHLDSVTSSRSNLIGGLCSLQARSLSLECATSLQPRSTLLRASAMHTVSYSSPERCLYCTVQDLCLPLACLSTVHDCSLCGGAAHLCCGPVLAGRGDQWLQRPQHPGSPHARFLWVGAASLEKLERCSQACSGVVTRASELAERRLWEEGRLDHNSGLLQEPWHRQRAL